MFIEFQKAFRRDSGLDQGNIAVETDYPKLTAFFGEFGGCSFEGGLYRVVSSETVSRWDERIAVAYPEYEGLVTCFAFDWLGRAFALDWNRFEDTEPGILMFEIGTGYALRVPRNLETFHEEELTQYREEALAVSFFERWIAAGGSSPSPDECVGYKKPLFLGGDDDLANLEIIDLDVYWHVTGQIAASARGKPEGSVLSASP